MTADAISAQPTVETREPPETAAALDRTTAADPIFARLEDEIEWYSRKSGRCQRLYKWLKFVEIVAAAAIPLLAAFDPPVEVLAALGALIVVLEGLQHVNQYQSNWITYRSTCEALKHEKFLYLASAGPYEVENPHGLLAERIESLISQEHAKWVSARREPEKAREQGA
jgi:Protein of unknown function (DUF4231)